MKCRHRPNAVLIEICEPVLGNWPIGAREAGLFTSRARNHKGAQADLSVPMFAAGWENQCPDARCRQRFNRNRAGADSNLRLADLAGYVATRWANVLRLQGVADLLALGWPGSC
jgi:hypothetical protein